MTIQHRGTVTLFFSDVEGSTRLLERLGRQGYGEVMERQRTLVREAFAAHDGSEQGTEGDSFFCVFATATDAVAAAADIQRTLAREPWPEGVDLPVRIGLHTGAPLVTDRYVGIAVHLAARVMSAAHGGQVLVSQTTRDLLEDALPDGLALRDLGEHRLKDLGAPQRLHQVLIPGVRTEFPTPRTLESRRTNLPVQTTGFVGRGAEVAAVAARLRNGEVRLLTLTGTAGTGKTRLALQAAAELVDDFADGVYFVPLAPVRDPALVTATVAQVLGVREQPGVTLAETVSEFLGDKHVLLVLDNFEHVISAASGMATLIKSDSRLRLLVTSREALHLSGEHVHDVPPLGLPDRRGGSSSPSHTSDAVALFRERARAVKSDFAVTEANAQAVGDICRRLDGLPLAIELAASRIALLPPAALLTRLDRRLKLLTGGARDLDDRQRTLSDAIAWSYDLLSESEQALFARLAVFVGGWRLEAAENVCDSPTALEADTLEGIASLLEKSLIRRREDPDGEPRFWMLETIREYALSALQQRPEADSRFRRHAEFFLALAEQAEADVAGGLESSRVYARLAADLGNLRAALVWAERTGDEETMLALGASLANFWMVRGHLSEGRRWLRSAAADGGRAPTAVRAKALGAAGGLAYRQGDYGAARSLVSGSLALWQKLGNEPEVAVATARLGAVAIAEEDLERATELYETSVEVLRRLGQTSHLASALSNLGPIAVEPQNLEQASELLEEAVELFRVCGRQEGLVHSLLTLVRVALAQERYARAAELLDETLALARQLGYTQMIGYCFKGLGEVAAAHSEYEQAARLLGAADAVFERLGVPLEPGERESYERVVADLRQRLGAQAFDAAHEDGRAAYLDRDLDRAVELLTPSRRQVAR